LRNIPRSRFQPGDILGGEGGIRGAQEELAVARIPGSIQQRKGAFDSSTNDACVGGGIYALTTTEPTIVPVLAVLWLDE